MKKGIEAETTKKKKKMHLFFFALSSSILAINTVAAAAAADLQSARHVLASMPKNYGLAIERRQETECSRVEPGPDFCERSCGPLFTACVFYDVVIFLLWARLVVPMQVNIIVPPPIFRFIFLETLALPANTLNFLGLTS